MEIEQARNEQARNEERGTRNELLPVNGTPKREWSLDSNHYSGSCAPTTSVREISRPYSVPQSGIRSFEDLYAWQKARAFARPLFELSNESKAMRDYSFADQLRRAIISVMSNIAEGHERISRAEFLHLLSIAKGSCAEVRSLLYVAQDLTYIDSKMGANLIDQADEVGRIIGALIVALRKGAKQQ